MLTDKSQNSSFILGIMGNIYKYTAS